MAPAPHKLAHLCALLLALPGFCLFLAQGQLETIDVAPELTCSEHDKTRVGTGAGRPGVLALLQSQIKCQLENLEIVRTRGKRLCSITPAWHNRLFAAGLIDCNVSSVSQFSAALPDPDNTVNVTHLHLEVVLCCLAKQDCELCLRILIKLQEVEELPAASGDFEDEASSGQTGPRASVIVCISSPSPSELCKAIRFDLQDSSLKQTHQHRTYELLLTERVMFGVPVAVNVDSLSQGPASVANIQVPSLEEVCSMDLGIVKECDTPKLRVVTDPEREVVLLQLENTDAGKEDEVMCQMMWNEVPGKFLAWPRGKREIHIPMNIVVPCLCFQVWWKGKGLRREFCPFKKQQDPLERMVHHISVSVAECEMRDGKTGLCWNVTAPCRLEAEVLLCRKGQLGGRCEEVPGTRQRLDNRTHPGWRSTPWGGHWRTGEFNESSQAMLCVQMKITGMKSELELQCPFASSRWRWSLLLFTGVLLFSLFFLGAYFIQGALKGYMWRWLKEDDLKGAVGGSQAVLLYPPDGDPALPKLMNRLGSSLRTLGFTVSLDLWSQGELSALGPVPWLHSRLNQVKRHGGKVVLVLTQATWLRAEEWGAQSWEKNASLEKNKDVMDTVSPASSDVFTASLSCVLADHLQGRAGERFMLVQFESLPPKFPGGFRPLPELFCGLHVYSLPSQSLGFLTELAGAGPVSNASARRRRAGVLRMASRFLARGLSGSLTGTTLLHIRTTSQNCMGDGVEDSWETMPLQPPSGQISPPSSPKTNIRVTKMECA